jgi:nucleoside-diphosphate-sugar epimerase
MKRILAEDFTSINEGLAERWDVFRGKTIFITGGTGFIGSWLCGSLLWANRDRKLGLAVIVLSRNPKAFLSRRPEICELGDIEFVTGDVRDFVFPDGRVDYVIHAATEASARLNAESPLAMIDTIVDGQRRVSEFARRSGAQRMLFLSSGAVYGKPRDGAGSFREDYDGAPDCVEPAQAYGEAKRLAELYAVSASRRDGYGLAIARCFAFVGPYLPLDKHFAVGNFIKNGLEGKPITITGDGRPLRSYMYAADLAAALLALLANQASSLPPSVYNVGSDQVVSIGALGKTVAQVFGSAECVVLGQSRATDRDQDYLPNIDKLKRDYPSLGIRSLEDALIRTKLYYTEG